MRKIEEERDGSLTQSLYIYTHIQSYTKVAHATLITRFVQRKRKEGRKDEKGQADGRDET